MKAKDIALILVVVVLVAFTPNSPISVLARDVMADARPAPLSASPVGTAFTYQGQLTDGGAPADGVYDFQFTLWDAETSGGQIGSTVTRGDIVVAGGFFTVELDFGASAFAGEARWLEIGVRPSDSSGSYTTLDPRQKVTPTPYALYASNADTLDGQHSSAFATSAHNHWGQTWSGSGTGLTLTSSNSIGLSASSTAGSGSTYGVYGTSNSTSGNGVVGWATAGSGSTYGVTGRSDSPSGVGVKGYTTATTGGTGVYGEAQATSGGAAGVTGISHANDGGTGIYGVGASSSGSVYGVYGWSQSTGGAGVNGYATAGSGTTYGVQGRSDSPAGWGGAFSSNGNGVSAAAPASGILYQGVQTPSGAVKFSVSGTGSATFGGDIAVAGDYRYTSARTRYYPVGAFEFVPGSGDVVAAGSSPFGADRFMTGCSSPDCILIARLDVPVGATMSEFSCHVYDNDPGDQVKVTWGWHDGGWSFNTIMGCDATTSADSTDIQTISNTSCNRTFDSGSKIYALLFRTVSGNPCSGNSNCRIYSCRIAYTQTAIP